MNIYVPWDSNSETSSCLTIFYATDHEQTKPLERERVFYPVASIT